ncbi:sugar phosphate isomerase/epimerase [Mucilaginibacter hurinus]|uniref:Sugar phosphate isomerase/epimerase n=1 Tax=Mucilaginibacter hurinus TaxID=2201324 RepID=A0A367GQL7_9SPHI|nr:sugar phosphate isomerase/epimerase [Mucilaginibacter hurinus]RCH55368.1 sugar phosphate isomerase/epimerase [Mucilaginibacter hurinus]
MTNRRTFLGQAGVAAAAILLTPELLSAKNINKVGLQLYSLRDYLPKDVKGVTAKVAQAGYKEVETYGYSKQNGYWGIDPRDYAKLLTQNGLVSPSGHYGIDQYLNDGTMTDLESYIHAAHTIGQRYIIAPGINGDLVKTIDGCKATAEKFNKVGQLLKKEGLKFAYHNHAWEWQKVGDTTFYDVLLKETDNDLVKLEMDIFWVVRGGLDPVTMLEKHPGKFALFHVKDSDKGRPELNTEVGKGTIDFKAIFAKAKDAGVKHFIVEQENFTNIDPYVSIAESSAYVKSLSV